MERFRVQNGNYKGFLFWGQHISGTPNFQPHGFAILIHEAHKQIQLGCFKQGIESGPQRIIQSLAPPHDPFFSQFVTLNHRLNGPCFFQSKDGSVESGDYKADRRDGKWILRDAEGSETIKMYRKGEEVVEGV